MTKEAEAVTKKEVKTAEKTTLRNRDIRGHELLLDDGTSIFVGAKGKVTLNKEAVSKPIRNLIDAEVFTEE